MGARSTVCHMLTTYDGIKTVLTAVWGDRPRIQVPGLWSLLLLLLRHGFVLCPQVMILITGAHKAFALYKAIEEGVNHMWTVSAFQQHPRTVFVCDEDATLELKVKTVKYFKGEGGVGLGVGGQVQGVPGVGSRASFHALAILIVSSDFNKNETLLSQSTQSFLFHLT